MGKIVMPKNSALLEEVMPALEIYYNADGWVSNDEYKTKLKEKIGDGQDDSAYTKKAQIPAYFGLITWQDTTNRRSPKKITQLGKDFYEHYRNNQLDLLQEDIMKALEITDFGRNNCGCLESDSDIEAPNVFLRGIMDLEYITFEEFAYLLWKLDDKGATYTDAILEIKNNRHRESFTLPEAANKFKDAKPIMVLERLGFLKKDENAEENGHYIIPEEILSKYKDRIKNLKIYNVDKNIELKESDASARYDIKQVKNIISDASRKDFSDTYKFFNDNYSVAVLDALEGKDLVNRLFASKDYAQSHNIPRGYFIWAEHGNYNDKADNVPCGKAKGHVGGMEGVLVKSDGSYHIYEYEYAADEEEGKSRKICNDSVIDEQTAISLANLTKTALKTIVEHIASIQLEKTEDYKQLLEWIKQYLLSLNEGRLYWNAEGEPDGLLLKYLHCSFPEKFACWYSKNRLKQLVSSVYPLSEVEDDALVLNGQLSLYANKLGIDNANFGAIWGFMIFWSNEEKTKDADYNQEKFMSEVFMDVAQYRKLVDLLEYKKNIILQGAPGVGKTFLAEKLVHSLLGTSKAGDQIEFVQFHQNYSYEDFIMGYNPKKMGLN